jgi:hypothetical protein
MANKTLLQPNSIALDKRHISAGHIFHGKPFVPVTPENNTDVEGTYILFFASLMEEALGFTGRGILCRIYFQPQESSTSRVDFSRPLGVEGETWLSKSNLLHNIPFTPLRAALLSRELTTKNTHCT